MTGLSPSSVPRQPCVWPCDRATHQGRDHARDPRQKRRPRIRPARPGRAVVVGSLSPACPVTGEQTARESSIPAPPVVIGPAPAREITTNSRGLHIGMLARFTTSPACRSPSYKSQPDVLWHHVTQSCFPKPSCQLRHWIENCGIESKTRYYVTGRTSFLRDIVAYCVVNTAFCSWKTGASRHLAHRNANGEGLAGASPACATRKEAAAARVTQPPRPASTRHGSIFTRVSHENIRRQEENRGQSLLAGREAEKKSKRASVRPVRTRSATKGTRKGNPARTPQEEPFRECAERGAAAATR